MLEINHGLSEINRQINWLGGWFRLPDLIIYTEEESFSHKEEQFKKFC